MNKPLNEWKHNKSWNGERCDFEPWEMNYHTSWNGLMPVVEKIENIGQSVVEIFKNHCCIKGVLYDIDSDRMVLRYDETTHSDNKIQATYKAVIQFIKWYNLQTP